MGDELSLLPETRPEDVEDVVWGLQTATTLWGRGEKREALVWMRRAAEAAGSAGDDLRAVELAKRAIELEVLFSLQPGAPQSSAGQSVAPASQVGGTPPMPPAQPSSHTRPPKPPPVGPAEIIEPDAELSDEETAERTLPGMSTPNAPPLPQPYRSAPPASAAPAQSYPTQSFPSHPPQAPAQPEAAPAIPLNKTQPLPIVQAHPLAATQASAPSAPPPSQARPAPPPVAPVPAAAPAAPVAVAAPPSVAAPPPVAAASSNNDAHAPHPAVSFDAAPQTPSPPSAAPPSTGTVLLGAPPQTPVPSPSVAPASFGTTAMLQSMRAAQKKKQRAPILDPWSDEVPDEPAPRTVGHRVDTFNDDDVITSAPSIDAMLKRNKPPPPPPPPKARSATLTGGPDQPTLEGAKSKLADLADDGQRLGAPPAPPTRKPTLQPTAPTSTGGAEGKSIPPAEGERISVPPPPAAPTLTGEPRSERKSMPPPPPPRRTTPPPDRASTPPPPPQPTAPGAAAQPPPAAPVTPPPSSLPPAAALFGEGLPPPPKSREDVPAPTQTQPGIQPVAAPPVPQQEHKTDPPPATMPAAQVAARASALPPAPRPPSAPPPPPRPASPPSAAAAAPPAASVAPAAPPRPAAPAAKSKPPTHPPAARAIGDLPLERVDAFADLPQGVQAELAAAAVVSELGVDEEVSGFGAALLLSGAAAVCATVADVAALTLAEAAIAPAMTSHPDGAAIRVVATAPSKVAVWDKATLENALRACPWVMEDLLARGDRIAAIAGATMGPLGDLDESSRFMTLDHIAIRTLGPSETLIAAGGEVAGLVIVGLGTVIQGDGDQTFSSGDVVLAGSVLEGGISEKAVKAGPQGAIVLEASRMKTLELFSTVPTLIELLRVV